MTRIYIASDHAGFELKRKLSIFLKDEMGFDVLDEGPYEYNENDDYPDYVHLAIKGVTDEKGSLGIILGGSGQGEAIAANRIKGIRAAVYYGGNLDIVKLSREHNDANVLSLGARFLSEEEAKEAVKLWLETSFSEEERHQRRNKKLDQW